MGIVKYILVGVLGCFFIIMSAMASTSNKNVSNQLQWHKAHIGVLPKNALVAGYSKNDPIYLCSAPFQAGVYPGQLTKKGCRITFAGNLYYSQDYRILVGHTANINWGSHSSYGYYDAYRKATHMYGYVPHGLTIANKQYSQPVVGGYESHSPSYLHVLYVCRTIFHNEIHIGKVVDNHCEIGLNGHEYYLPVTQVLNWTPNYNTPMQPLVNPSHVKFGASQVATIRQVPMIRQLPSVPMVKVEGM